MSTTLENVTISGPAGANLPATVDNVRAQVAAVLDGMRQRDDDRLCVSGADPDAPAPIPPDDAFGDEAHFLDASHPSSAFRLSHIVDALIVDDPERLGHLQTATFRCLWQRVGAKEAGVPVLGKASRPGKLQRWLAGDVDFFLVLAADHCAGLTNWQLEAQLYHLLCACDVDPDTGKPATRPAEFSGYVAEVERYGLWSAGMRQAQVAFRQLALDSGEAA